MAKDNDYRRMIHTSRWLRLRRSVLTAHPCCRLCESEGFVTAASEVHHIVPVESASSPWAKEQLMFSPKNLEALCHDCHVRRHKELGRSGKSATRRLRASQLDDFHRHYLGEGAEAPSDEP